MNLCLPSIFVMLIKVKSGCQCVFVCAISETLVPFALGVVVVAIRMIHKISIPGIGRAAIY